MPLPRRPRWSRPETAAGGSGRRLRTNDERPGLRISAGIRASNVDIVCLCSNKSTTAVTAAQIREISASVRDSLGECQPRVKRGWNRLNTDQQAAVVTRYSNGETSATLAEEYGVAKSTILRILREARVVVRRQPMTPEQVSDAAQIYVTGSPLSQVAKRLGVNQETMRTAILKAGVVLREPTKAETA